MILSHKVTKVLGAEIYHESNPFNPKSIDIEAFKNELFLIGNDAVIARGDTNTDLAGVLDSAGEYGWQYDHVLSAKASPGGTLTDDAFDAICKPILNALQKAKDEQKPYDGIIFNFHGAMITDSHDDGEGEILNRVREITGMDIPIAITLDPHANVSEEMCHKANIVLAYKTYPHTDMRINARHAGEILHKSMTEGVQSRTLRVPVPMLEEANGGSTTEGAMIPRIAMAREHEQLESALAVSIIAGFPANVAFVGPSVLVTYFGEIAPHLKFAKEIALDIWDRRHEVINTYLSVEKSVEMAVQYDHKNKPLIIVDYADNPGAGAPGDSTALLQAMLESNVQNACFGPMVDEDVANAIHALMGAGDKKSGDIIKIKLGGKHFPTKGGGALDIGAEIVSIHDGDVLGSGPMIKGIYKFFGATVVLRVQGVDVLVVSTAQQMLDLEQFKTFGVTPENYNVVALKSMQHFRAAFDPIAGKTIICDSGALCSPSYRKEDFPKAPIPTFPLENTQ